MENVISDKKTAQLIIELQKEYGVFNGFPSDCYLKALYIRLFDEDIPNHLKNRNIPLKRMFEIFKLKGLSNDDILTEFENFFIDWNNNQFNLYDYIHNNKSRIFSKRFLNNQYDLIY